MSPNSEFQLSSPVLRIAPSLLAADFSCLAEQVATIERAGADLLHLDIMDGHFVDNISFGPDVIRSLRPHTELFFDAHLMISQPKKYAERFIDAGCDHITFHVEVVDDPGELAQHIRRLGASVGICLNPTTPVSAVEHVLPELDLVLIMSVWPGFGGQAFIPQVLEKVEQLSEWLDPHQRLEIDGGIDANTIEQAVCAGADTIVAGSAIFGRPDPQAALDELRAAAVSARQPDAAED